MTRSDSPIPDDDRRGRVRNGQQRSWSGLAMIVAALILGGAGAFGLVAVGEGISQRSGDGVTVTGSARMEVEADRAVWTINAYEQADDVAMAVRRVGESLDAVTGYLMAGGIDAALIELDGLSTSINYRWTDQGMTSEISSYSAYRTLRVRSDDVQLIDRLNRDFGDLLTTGIGVTAYQPEYLISDLPSLRPQLQANAVEDALARAEAMLAVVGGQIGTVRSIRSGPFQVSAPDSVDVSDYGMYDTSTIRKSVSATVSVTFSGG
jgi:uncharacterized protein